MYSKFSVFRLLLLVLLLVLALESTLIASFIPSGIRLYTEAVSSGQSISIPFNSDFNLRLPELQIFNSTLQVLSVLLIVLNAYLIVKLVIEIKMHKQHLRIRTELPPRERLDARMTISRAV